MINRVVTAADLARTTCSLWGPRQFGKSTLLRGGGNFLGRRASTSST